MDKNILFQGKNKVKAIPLTDIRFTIKKEIDCIKGYKKYKKINDLQTFILSTQTISNPKKFKTIESLHKEIKRYNDLNCVVNLNKMKRPELLSYAKKRGIDVGETIRGTAPRKTAGNAFKPLQDLTGVKKYASTTEQKEIEDKLSNVEDPFDVDIKLTDENGNLTGETTKLKLRTKQTEFIEKMVYSNNRGGIAFWGVGTGKTVLTVLTIRNYLHYFPEGKVVFVAPSGLLSNLIKTLFLFGLDIRDNRIHYYSYERYVRIKENCLNGLLVIDEAHNLRTQIKTDITGKKIKVKNDKGVEVEEDEIKAKKGGRPYAILEYCSKSASKVLLLTATPLVNTPLDINNLLGMIDGRMPLDPKSFFEIITNKEQAEDFLSYRVSHFIRKFDDADFPSRKEQILYTKMTPEETKDFNEIQQLGKGDAVNKKSDIEGAEDEKYSQSFYSGQRQFINKVGNHKKLSLVLDHIKKQEDTQNVVYLSFVEKGIIPLIKKLEKDKIKYAVVSGSEGAVEKQKAVEDYNNGKIRVIIISRAGAEGLDLKKTNNLYVLDQPWNEAMREQVIGRGIRYKSHEDLPVYKRAVNVYNVFLLKSGSEEELFTKKLETITDDKDFNLVLNLYKEKQAEEDLKNEKKSKAQGAKAVIWVSEEDKLDAKKMGMSMVKFYEDVSFQKYADQRTRAEKFNPPLNLSIDPYLYMYSKSKQYVINEFVKFLDSLPPFEKGISSVEKAVLEVLQKENPQNRIEKLNIWKRELRERMIKAGKIITERNRMIQANLNKIVKSDLLNKEKMDKLRNSTLQQYFTSDEEIKKLYMLSNIENDPRKSGIQFLEPTAGTGAILKYVYEKNMDRMEVKCCEYDPETRTHLKTLINTLGLGAETLFNQPNFLKLNPSDRFDYIIMNPPFNIKPYRNLGYKKAIYDIDFIKHAYMCCKVGGRIVALLYGEHAKENLKDRLGLNYEWLKEHAKPHFRNPKTGEKDLKFLRQTVNWMGATDKKMAKEEGQKIKGLKVATVIIDKKDNTEDETLFNEMRDLIEWNEGQEPKWTEIPQVVVIPDPEPAPAPAPAPAPEPAPKTETKSEYNEIEVFNTYNQMKESFKNKNIKFPIFTGNSWISQYGYNYILEKNSNDCLYQVIGRFGGKTGNQKLQIGYIETDYKDDSTYKKNKQKLEDNMKKYGLTMDTFGRKQQNSRFGGYTIKFLINDGFDKVYENYENCWMVGDILCIPLTIGDLGGHRNMLIINGYTKSFERYEPHGARTGGRELNMNNYLDSEKYDEILKKMMNYINKEYDEDFKYVEPSNLCPKPPKEEKEKATKLGFVLDKKEMKAKYGNRVEFGKSGGYEKAYIDGESQFYRKGGKGKFKLWSNHTLEDATEYIDKNVGFQHLDGVERGEEAKEQGKNKKDMKKESLELYNNILYKEVGGYCVMWGLFLMDLRLKSPKEPAQELFSRAFKSLRGGDKPFLTFIRGFTMEIMADMEHNFKGTYDAIIKTEEGNKKVGKKGGISNLTKKDISSNILGIETDLKEKVKKFLEEKVERANERISKRIQAENIESKKKLKEFMKNKKKEKPNLKLEIFEKV